MKKTSRSRRTVAAQLGQFVCPETRGFVPPIHMATTFERDPTHEVAGQLIYARSDNPTFRPVETTLAELEAGEDCLLFASGMAAAAGVAFALEPGARIVAPARFYAGIWEWFNACVKPWGVKIDFVDFSDLDAVRHSTRSSRCDILWLETPTTPGLDIVPIELFATIAHEAGARLLVDNTSATPVLTQPLALGADLVLHSATKALNGHDDVIAGALIAAEADSFWERIKQARNKNGAIMGSFEAWLLGRGLRTLFPRVQASCEGALRLARNLDLLQHPEILEMSYPGLPSHPQHDLATRQMSGLYGTMISLRLAKGEWAAKSLMSTVGLWRSGTSFGGVQSMLEHRSSVEADYPPTPTDLVRLSVGLEDPDELLSELIQSLDALGLRSAAETARPLPAHLAVAAVS